MRALFLSADVGVGHTSAANALRIACREIDPSFESCVVDSYKYAASVVSRVVSSGYIGMVKAIPQMYRFLYDRAERATGVGPFRTWAHQFTAENLRSFMEEYAPDIVVCTHAFPCGAMAEYKKRFPDCPPVVGVVTDFAVHTFWIHPSIDGYAVATQAMRETMVARGVPEDRVAVSGIPVHPAFGERGSTFGLREQLDLPRDRNIVLVMGGGLGMAPLQTIMRALDGVRDPICAVAIVGRSKRAASVAIECAARVRYPVRALRFVKNVHDYMRASDVLVSKPGGLTSSEALAAGLPMVLFKALPGQEERNTRFLVGRGAALRATSAAALTSSVQLLLTSREKQAEMRAAMRELGRPDAAARVAQAMYRLATSAARREAIA